MTLSDVLVLIMAKHASSRVPCKNLAAVNDMTVLDYTCNAAHAMQVRHDTVVLTESVAVQKIAARHGFSVFMESGEEVVDYEGRLYERVTTKAESAKIRGGLKYKVVLVVCADVPLRPFDHFDVVVREVLRTAADVVITTIQVPIRFHPQRLYVRQRMGNLEGFMPNGRDDVSQTYRPLFAATGAATGYARSVLPKIGQIGYDHPSLILRTVVCTADQILEIDTPEDLAAFRATQCKP